MDLNYPVRSSTLNRGDNKWTHRNLVKGGVNFVREGIGGYGDAMKRVIRVADKALKRTNRNSRRSPGVAALVEAEAVRGVQVDLARLLLGTRNEVDVILNRRDLATNGTRAVV
jgi:hypothetical protein